MGFPIQLLDKHQIFIEDMPHKSTEAGHPPGMAKVSARVVQVMEGAVGLM